MDAENDVGIILSLDMATEQIRVLIHQSSNSGRGLAPIPDLALLVRGERGYGAKMRFRD